MPPVAVATPSTPWASLPCSVSRTMSSPSSSASDLHLSSCFHDPNSIAEIIADANSSMHAEPGRMVPGAGGHRGRVTLTSPCRAGGHDDRPREIRSRRLVLCLGGCMSSALGHDIRDGAHAHGHAPILSSSTYPTLKARARARAPLPFLRRIPMCTAASAHCFLFRPPAVV